MGAELQIVSRSEAEQIAEQGWSKVKWHDRHVVRNFRLTARRPDFANQYCQCNPAKE